MPSTLPASNRLLPFARDHDRLLVALLYLDHQEFGISILNRRIERLKLRQAWLAQCIIFKEAKMAEIQASRDIPEEQKREFLGALVEVIRTARNGIDEARRYTDNVTVERDQAQANLSHRQKVSRLLANLYSSAFNGDTPEFPHEDRLEALVAAAELESAKCFQANDTLADQGRRVLQMNGIIGELAKLLEHVHLSIRARDGQAVEYALLENRWREALRLYNDLKDLTRQPMDDQSSCPLHQIDEVDNVEDFLRAMNNAAHAAEKCQIAGCMLENMLDQTNLLCRSLREIQPIYAQRREQEMKKFKTARAVLALRVVQLAEARRRILDHVIDPDNCPLHDPLVDLPSYSPRQSACCSATVPQFTQADGEMVSREEYVEELVDSWYSRLQRANYSPIPLPEFYGPPKYSDIDGSMTDGANESVPTLHVTPGFHLRFLISRRAKGWCEGVERVLARASENLLPVVNHG